MAYHCFGRHSASSYEFDMHRYNWKTGFNYSEYWMLISVQIRQYSTVFKFVMTIDNWFIDHHTLYNSLIASRWTLAAVDRTRETGQQSNSGLAGRTTSCGHLMPSFVNYYNKQRYMMSPTRPSCQAATGLQSGLRIYVSNRALELS